MSPHRQSTLLGTIMQWACNSHACELCITVCCIQHAVTPQAAGCRAYVSVLISQAAKQPQSQLYMMFTGTPTLSQATVICSKPDSSLTTLLATLSSPASLTSLALRPQRPHRHPSPLPASEPYVRICMQPDPVLFRTSQPYALRLSPAASYGERPPAASWLAHPLWLI